MSASDGNGAYQNDESYNKYSDSGRGKLVCDFVIGGNTSRQPAGSSLRTNNYSPTGYLNKRSSSRLQCTYFFIQSTVLSMACHPFG